MTLDSIEAWANAIGGLVVSWAAVRLLWPLYGWEIGGQAWSVTLLFFALSWGRSRALRAIFRRMGDAR